MCQGPAVQAVCTGQPDCHAERTAPAALWGESGNHAACTAWPATAGECCAPTLPEAAGRGARMPLTCGAG